jgi:MATE family multidrug resistance protein
MSLGGSMIERSPNKSLNRSIQTYTIEPNYKEIALNLLSCSFQTALGNRHHRAQGYICLDVVFAISLHFVQADISAVANAGVGLAYTICSIMVLPMGFGVNQSLNVHVAQALGAEQTKLSKTYLPMTFWVHFMYFVPFSLILYFLKVPFSYTIPAADRAETVDAAWEYLPWMLLSSIFAIELECFKSYLIAHEIFTPFIVIHFSTTGLHVLWCWLLI